MFDSKSQVIISGCLAISLVSMLLGTLSFWELSGPVLSGGAFLPVMASSTIILLLVLLKMIRFSGQRHAKTSPHIFEYFAKRFSQITFSLALLFILLSQWTCRDYSFFSGPSFRGEILLCVILIYLIPQRDKALKLISLLSLGLLALLFLFYLHGRLLTSDDHATFIYRLSLLKREFPDIPFYFTRWNAGIDARDFFATGAIGIFLLFSPLIYLCEVQSIYNILVTLLIFLLGPSLYYIASRKILGYPKQVSVYAAFFSVLTSLITYRWILKYGTIGFYLSLSLLPLVIATIIRVIERTPAIPRKIWWTCLISSSFMSLWSPSLLMIAPLGILAIIRLPFIIKKKGLISLILAGVILNGPWMMLFWKVSNVGSFISNKSQSSEPTEREKEKSFRHKPAEIDLRASLHLLREETTSANPAIVIGLFTLIPLMRRPHRKIWGILIAWLVAVGTIAVSLKPQLELDRFFLGSLFLGCLPASLALRRMSLLARIGKPATKMIALTSLGITVSSVLSIASVIQNKSLIEFSVESKVWTRLQETLANLPHDGRILFTGCILHEVNGSHIAPLALTTDQSLIASSPFHNIWWYTDSVPMNVSRNGEDYIINYLRKLNVQIVVAHDPKWKKYLRRSKGFEQITTHDQFAYFKIRNNTLDYFLRGSGTLEDNRRDEIVIKPATESLVIKFNWYPFLKSSSCEITPYDAGDNLTFIELTKCIPGSTVTVKAISPLERLLDNSKLTPKQ